VSTAARHADSITIDRVLLSKSEHMHTGVPRRTDWVEKRQQALPAAPPAEVSKWFGRGARLTPDSRS
jgi:hypothetical protein